MRRLPIYFLIDVSESMVGEPIEQVQNGIRTIIQDLRTDPYALETVFVSIIAFAGKAKILTPMTELYKFYPPIMPIGGGTSLGAALNFLMDDLDKNIVKTTMEAKGDWKPIVFLFTDGVPTDDHTGAFARWNSIYRRSNNLVAISIGDNADVNQLGEISDNVLRLKNTDEKSFKEFFKWVTASIKASSETVNEYSSDELKLASTDGINLEKIDKNTNYIVDENFAIIMAKCQSTQKPYLIKYAKRSQAFEDLDFVKSTDFKLIGAFPIEEEVYNELSEESGEKKNINTMELIGAPTCPCCGNQHGAVVCECGNLFCVGEDIRCKCPWCGMEGYLGEGSSGGTDINRTIG